MTDFQVRSDNVDVEQIMRQIRARIREKRGVDYTEEEIKELARVKLEKFLDPTGVRSDLLAQYRKANADGPARNYKFENTTLFESSRGWLRFVRKMLQPILKLFFNPNPLIDALHIQAELNETTSKRTDLQYELIHNLVLETTRLGIQVKNLKMQVESMSSRLDFDERRARALEGVVQYRPGTAPPLQPPLGVGTEGRDAAAQERRTRRRRRRGRRPPREAGAPDANGAAELPQAGDADGGSTGRGFGRQRDSVRGDHDESSPGYRRQRENELVASGPDQPENRERESVAARGPEESTGGADGHSEGRRAE